MGSAYDKALREAASRFKSFPDAINAHLRNAFDRGATDVRISYNVAEGCTYLMIEDNGRPLARDQFVAITNPSPDPRDSYETLALTGAHHADMLTVENAGLTRTVNYSEYDESRPTRYKELYPRVVERDGSLSKASVAIQLWFLGAGDGVDPRQDRTAARLVKRLPAMLSVRETGMVTVADEKGTVTRLESIRSAPEEKGDYVVWAPSLRATFNHHRPLLLQYGGVRVPISTVLSRTKAFTHERWITRRRVNTLNSSWFTGVIEITRKDGKVEFPDPLDDFPDKAYDDKLVQRLVAFLVATGIVETMDSEMVTAADALWRTVARSDGSFTFNHVRYDLCANTKSEDEETVWKDAGDRRDRTGLLFDPLCPILQADCRSELIIERLTWLVAYHLAGLVDIRQKFHELLLALRESHAA